MCKLIVGTRKSKLALIQTKWVIAQLKKAGVKNPIEIKEIETTGDKKLNVSLPKLGGRGIFLAEIQEKLLDEQIDFAVHSLKDMLVTLPKGLGIAAIPTREDPRDALLNKHHHSLLELPEGALVGTSSLRRAAQLLRKRPDIQTKWIRGPIDSRIEQMLHGDFNAIVLAMAGLNRLGIGHELITERFPTHTFVPAIGQGTLAIECRTSDNELRNILSTIHDDATAKAMLTERTFLGCFKDGEQAPIGGYAYVNEGKIHLHGMVTDTKGKNVLEHETTGTDPEKLAQEVATILIERGANDIISAVNKEIQQS